MPRASVVITFHDQPAELCRSLRALAAAGLDDVEVVLVDNGSRDARTPALLEAWADRATVLRNPVDAGPVAARNQGARAARSPVVVWLDPRAEVRPGWLDPLVLAAAAPGAGVAGAVLLAPDGRVRSAGRALVGRGRIVDLHPGVPGDHPVVRGRAVRVLGGELVAVSRDALLDAGGLDLAFGAGVAEADLCMRMWDAGRQNAVAAAVAVLHGDAPAPSADDGRAFRRRWHAADPDRDDLLAEDGVADPGWADCVWEGPLLDDSPEAAEGRDALRALATAGRRPMVREPAGTPLAAEAAGWCDEAILAALNRHRVGVPGAETFRGGPVPGAALRPAGREGIGWLGALLGRSGYAAAARGVIGAAHRAGLPVLALVTDATADGLAPPELALPPQDFAPGLIVIHGLPVMPSGVPFWDEAAADLGLPVVGATCFETELVPPSWVAPCNRVREVWVPSGFNARTFADAGVDPERIHVVPYPVDTARLRPAARERDPGAPLTFLSVFEWTWRKGWDVLLRAWAEEFAPRDPVRLVIVTYRGAGASGGGSVEEQALARLAALGAGPGDVADIELMLDPVPHEAMPGLYASADAFVLPTRGEGAGMPMLEAAACGVPVIATAWGGHEELMTPRTAYPVAVERMVEAPAAMLADNVLYRGLVLAEPSVASLRAAMRAVADDPAAAAARGLRGRALVEERFSIAATARALDARARALLGGRDAAGVAVAR